ncbi:MAG: xanthine dehydrogenase family protein molybdopterin-binding subunit [Pseudomonadota bacterium]
MTKFGISQPVRRVEDKRFLTGQGNYIEDLSRPGQLRAFFLRAPVAHAKLTIDAEPARSAPGVHMVMTGADLDAALDNGIDFLTLPNRDGTTSAAPKRSILAIDMVFYVGDPVACVVAETLAQAKDAAEMIEVDYEDLPVVIDMEAAMAPGAAQLHPEAPNNICYDWGIGDQDATEAALGAAHRTVTMKAVNNRVHVASMETRGCLADWDGEMLTFHVAAQGVHRMGEEFARRLGLTAETCRVMIHDVGGAFGMKNFNYPEYFCASHASMKLGRPVKWISERGEALLSDCAGRDNVTRLTMGFDEGNKITAFKTECLSNLGGYNSPFGVIMQSQLYSRVLTGTYDIQTVWMGTKGIYTNTIPTDAYRGAGRPEAQYSLERFMDHAARELGVTPDELRRINFIKPDQFPYATPTGENYDVGDFVKVMERGLAEADWAGFDARKAASAAQGKLRGRGLCFYIESILGAPNESAEIIFQEDGTVDLHVGTQSNGQGHETVYAQILHEHAGIPFDKIRIRQGDSHLIPFGGGTGGSRSVTTQSTAINGATNDLVAKMRPLAEEELEVAGADLVWEGGLFKVAGTDRTVDLMTLATVARSRGMTDLLSQRTETELPGRSYPNGCHIAEAEVDPETGVTKIVKYTVVDDFGRLMNPMLAEGQVHGGVAQGIGQALTEHVVYDEDGQLLAASFMDYAMPRADDVPMVPFTSEPVYSTANYIGMKGCGEAGTVGALAASTNAVLDALWEQGVHHVDMPATPLRVWNWLQSAKTAAE